MVVCYTMIVLFHTVLHHDGVIYFVLHQCFRPVDGAVLHHDISNSEYLVRNPVQAALQSNKRLKAKHFFEYFWLGMTLRPKGSRNLS